MKLYAFRITWNLMTGTVCLTPFKWIAKTSVRRDRIYSIIGIFRLCFAEGCDGYSARIGAENLYPAPNEIVEINRRPKE